MRRPPLRATGQPVTQRHMVGPMLWPAREAQPIAGQSRCGPRLDGVPHSGLTVSRGILRIAGLRRIAHMLE
jgi:hypothetical protein